MTPCAQNEKLRRIQVEWLEGLKRYDGQSQYIPLHCIAV